MKTCFRLQGESPLCCWSRLVVGLLALLTLRSQRAVALSSMSSSSSSQRHFIGFDLGTSGARISVIQDDNNNNNSSPVTATDASPQEVYTRAIPWKDGAYNDPTVWMDAVTTLLQGASTHLPTNLDSVVSMCISGTSASCLLVDQTTGHMTREPCMYNYDVVQSDVTGPAPGQAALELLTKYAPERHTARSPTGSLAKLLAWNAATPVANELLCHQADYIALQFLECDKNDSSGGGYSVSSDWHNCLKLGYDVRQLDWPEWMEPCLQAAGIAGTTAVLPAKIVSPGEPMGTISANAAVKFGLPATVQIVGGTTDSNAAFFAATGAQPELGTAVTSLGSTLALKQLSSEYVEDASVGVYSHRFPSVLSSEQEAWLVGGASNVGCAVLRQLEFSNDELDQLSKDIDPDSDSPLSYYPLTRKGERFPVADSEKKPVLEPVPEQRKDFLHGILQGISDVERDGFLELGKLGASPAEPVQVWTCGGGSRNDMWTSMRERRLRNAFQGDNTVQVARAENVEASYGAALLAAASFQ